MPVGETFQVTEAVLRHRVHPAVYFSVGRFNRDAADLSQFHFDTSDERRILVVRRPRRRRKLARGRVE